MDDAEEIFHGYATDPEVTRYLVWEPHRSLADTRAFLRACMECWRGQSRFPWAITRGPDTASIGMIELRLDGHKADVGYVLAREEWGKGYMTEALTAVVEAAFALRDVYRVGAVCDVENIASARVMEKAGLVKEGVLKRYLMHPGAGSEPRDAFCYAKTR
jgi:ribosomal-protein-alanine N-acetyltransferase